MNKDIFISYKNDNAGNNFATRLKEDLENNGYSVYFNSDENHSGDFPERLKEAIKNCKDFILIVSQGCLTQLIEHNKVDWIREEVLTAYHEGKHIIPIMMSGVEMPKDKDDMPEELRFLPSIDNITLPEQYKKSPFEQLIKVFVSKAEKDDVYRDTYNSNEHYDIKSEFAKVLSEANDGDCLRMYELATLYYYGFCGENGETHRDYDKAYYWFKKLMEVENEYKQYAESIIAEMYFFGTIPRETQSYEKALEFHKKAAEKSGFSSREFAYLSSRGCGCDFDYKEIENNYLSAIEKGDNVAILGLARFYMDYGRFKEAAELYKRTSNIIPDAEFRIGMLYRNGLLSDPPEPDFFKAAFYFQHAISSKKCSADVYHELGRLYFTPTGDFPKDFKEAEKYFTIAADMGQKDAQYKLGLMYEYGYVQKNIERAIHYHTLSANQGVPLAAYHLSLIYQEYEKNYHKAYQYAQLAANKGVMEGEYVLGMLLFMGRGCVADENKAYEFFVKAYSHGMQQAKIMIDKIERK